MRTWIWAWCVLPAVADVLCDVRMSERQVMMINPSTGDEKYTASTLEVECNDVFQDNGNTVSNPWPIYLKGCRDGMIYDKVSGNCGQCPDRLGEDPKDSFDVPDNAQAWWNRECMPMEAEGTMQCLCRWEYWDEETGRHGQGSGTTPMKGGCSADEQGCLQYALAREVWQYGMNSLKLPSYTCTGLDPFAPAGDVGAQILLPPLEKDALFHFLRFTFQDGVVRRSVVQQEWGNTKENVVKILFMSRISKSGQDLAVGPSLAEIASNCNVNLNIYFDQQGTAVNNGQAVSGSLVPTYSPLCVEEDIIATKAYMTDIIGQMTALAQNNNTCNSSNSGGKRRLSKQTSEADELLKGWRAAERAQGKPPPTMLQLIQRKNEAEWLIKTRKAAKQRAAQQKRRKLSGQEHYLVQGEVTFSSEKTCGDFDTAFSGVADGEWQRIYHAMFIAALGTDSTEMVEKHFQYEPKCNDAATGGSDVTLAYKGDAGPTTDGDEQQTAWFNAIQSTSTGDLTSIQDEMKKLVLEIAQLTLTTWTIDKWDVNVAQYALDNGGNGGNGGDGGDGNQDNYQDGDVWWEFQDGMDCQTKRWQTEERAQKLLQHAFIITGKDTWAGCKGLLDSWVVYGPTTKTRTTNKCTVPYELMSGAINPEWLNDPCCNWVKRQEQCCGPRTITENITIVDALNEDNIALYSAATDSGTLALDLAMMYASLETEAAKSCFGPYKAFMDSTNDIWKVVDTCRTAVEGAWSDTYQVQLGPKCTSDIDCYTGECYAPVSNSGGSSSSGTKQKYCKTPDEMANPNWGQATLTCLIDKSIPELKGRLKLKLKVRGDASAAVLATKFLEQPGMMREECRGHDNPHSRYTMEDCMAPKQCNYDGSISNETECLNPCEEGDVSCSGYCGQGNWEVGELPQCIPKGILAGHRWPSAAELGELPSSERILFLQILRLCSHFHRAFLQKDKGQLIALASELQRHGHLLRPAEVSMALNHFAHSKILDEALWTTFSETLIQANAYARAMLQHEETLTFLARQVEAVAWKGQMEARNLVGTLRRHSRVVGTLSRLPTAIGNGGECFLQAPAQGAMGPVDWFSGAAHQLEYHTDVFEPVCDEELMGAISFQLKSSVANGYARLWLHDAEVFEAMQEKWRLGRGPVREPLIDALPSCSIQNLAMIAHVGTAEDTFLTRFLECGAGAFRPGSSGSCPAEQLNVTKMRGELESEVEVVMVTDERRPSFHSDGAIVMAHAGAWRMLAFAWQFRRAALHAYGRFFRRDEPLLLALCRQLLERQRRCGEAGQNGLHVVATLNSLEYTHEPDAAKYQVAGANLPGMRAATEEPQHLLPRILARWVRIRDGRSRIRRSDASARQPLYSPLPQGDEASTALELMVADTPIYGAVGYGWITMEFRLDLNLVRSAAGERASPFHGLSTVIPAENMGSIVHAYVARNGRGQGVTPSLSPFLWIEEEIEAQFGTCQDGELREKPWTGL
ncbi:Uncharacterized protein SCF082_LOCUS16117 [Durusdinium trenchii]|uniref:Uncharacterized protein n=1 Tax=Durusdinium trenchii TaxID=1381693 RepID=A0ABP0K8S7_9DINO